MTNEEKIKEARRAIGNEDYPWSEDDIDMLITYIDHLEDQVDLAYQAGYDDAWETAKETYE